MRFLVRLAITVFALVVLVVVMEVAFPVAFPSNEELTAGFIVAYAIVAALYLRYGWPRSRRRL